MNYEEKLNKARKTGKGIVSRFQEKPNYKMAVGEGYDCPYCGAYHGYKMNGNKCCYDKPCITNKDIYEIPNDIKFMCEHGEYSWTEDCKCANCGKMYSQNDGC